jgi:hypothetical protein
MATKRLTEEQFRLIEQLPTIQAMGEQNRSIAFRCLVQGESQISLAREFSLTRGAVSQTVNRVWGACPPGYRLVTALVSVEQAEQIKQWERAAKAAIKGET